MRVFTFPGQGTPINLNVFQSYLSQTAPVFLKVFHDPKRRDLVRFIDANPANPGSISAVSNMLYRLYQLKHPGTQQQQEQKILLGHSLGELSCLSAGNSLFSLQDTFDIANYRNKLMVEATKNYLQRNRFNDSFQMWAVSSPSSKSLRQELDALLPSFPQDVAIANDNSEKQCVLTGLQHSLETLRPELQTRFRRVKVKKLTNPESIPFHNNAVLRPIQEPLYDYLSEKVKERGMHTTQLLNYAIVTNLKGELTDKIDVALENFVKCSSNTVEFVSCCETLKKNGVTHAINIGPGTVLSGLLRRNYGEISQIDYDEVDKII